MKPKRTLSGYALLVGVLSLSVVGGALIYGIYSALVKTQISPEQKTLITPLDGSIDQGILNDLQKRRRFTQSELAARTAPTVIPTPTVATSPATIEASPGGEINQP